MKSFTTLATLAAYLTMASTLAMAAPTSIPRDAPSKRQTSAADLQSAVAAWASDTDKVSNFLDAAAGLTGADFITQATTAAMNEMDELTHKAVLDADATLAATSLVQTANTTLVTNGSFQMVVNLLQDMATNGQAKVGDVQLINNVRCLMVLPAINMYFLAVSQATGSGVATLAIFPQGCNQVVGFNAALENDPPARS